MQFTEGLLKISYQRLKPMISAKRNALKINALLINSDICKLLVISNYLPIQKVYCVYIQ